MEMNYTSIVSMIMRKAELQQVLDAAALYLDAAILFVNETAKVIAYSTAVPLRDPYWQQGIQANCFKEVFIRSNKSRYVKSLLQSTSSGISYPPDDTTLKFWVQLQGDPGYSTVTAVALPAEDAFPAQKQDLFRSFAWLIKTNYLDNAMTPKTILHSAERDALFHVLNQTADITATPSLSGQIPASESMFTDTHIVVFQPDFQKFINSLWVPISMRIDDILGNSTATVFRDCIVALADSVSKEKREKLILLTRQSNARVGISWRFSGKENVRRHYKQALFSINAAKILNKKERICDYDNYFIYAVIEHSRKRDSWAKHIFPALSVLQEYDAQHKASLYETFYYYLRNGTNITLTAQALGAHKSTLQHRLDIIKDLLADFDIFRPEMQLSLLLAYDIEAMRTKTVDPMQNSDTNIFLEIGE